MLSKTDIDLNLRHPLSLACGSSLLSSLSIVCNAPQPVHQPPGSTSAVEVESPRAGSRDSSCSVSHTRSAAASPGWLHCTRCAWRRVLRARPTSDERTQRDGARTLRHESCRCRATPLSDLSSAQLRLLSCIAAFPLQLASRAPKHKLSSAGVITNDGTA